MPPRGSCSEDKREKVYTSADHRAWRVIFCIKIIKDSLICSHAMLLLIYKIYYESKLKL